MVTSVTMPDSPESCIPLQTVSTDANGDYTITDVLAGTYDLTVTIPSDFTGTTSTESVTVVANQTTTQDFALEPITTGTVSGTVFSDDNGNGMHDSGESGIVTDVTITTNPARTASTHANGDYTITDVLAGTYDLTVTIPAHFTGTTSTVSVTVVADQTTTQDFALAPRTVSNTAMVTGTLFDLSLIHISEPTRPY